MRDRDDTQRGHEDRHPDWMIPFWMLLALAGMFVLGCACGACFLTKENISGALLLKD